MIIDAEIVLCTSLAILLYAVMLIEPSTSTDPAASWKFPTTPMMDSKAVNTEDVIAESPEDSLAPLPTKRPQAAVYPLTAGRTKKPFSRSAQKRQSVQMLGSIEHLQHHFSKIGLTSKRPPPSKLGALPAIGPGAVSDDSPPRSPTSISVPILPPSPAQPGPAPKPAYLLGPPVKVDPEALRAKATDYLRTVTQLWDLSSRDQRAESNHTRHTDILEVLKCTVAAIRAVRAFSLSLPSSVFNRAASTTGFLSVPSRQSISTTSRPSLRVVSGGTRPLGSEEEKDPLVDVRKAALEVLVSLRTLEEKCRVHGSNKPLHEDVVRTRSPDQSGLSSPVEGVTSMMTAIAGPLDGEPSYEEEAEYYDGVNFGTESQELRKTWEEKLASGEEGWLYRNDVDLVQEFPAERQGVKLYLEIVEDVLFGAGETYVVERRGWAWDEMADEASGTSQAKAASRRNSGQDVQEKWLQGDWEGQELNRVHEFLLAHLPLSLQILIPPITPSGDASAFLARLSDGYLVALAFNAAIEKSEKPWGLISGADVHDTLDVVTKESEAKDWTFRRVENLTAFAAALRHRYNIPVQIPTSAPSSVDPLFLPAKPSAGTISGRRVSGQRPSTIRERSSDAERIVFDPLVVARKEAGWDVALQAVLLPWLDQVCKERRSSLP